MAGERGRRSATSLIHGSGASSHVVDGSSYRAVHFPDAAAALRNWERHEVGWRGLRTSYVDRLPALAVSTLILHGANGRRDARFV